jgi:hypothetical protein
MKAQDWTEAVQRKLKKLGKEKGYGTGKSGKRISMPDGKKDFKMQPDVVWEMDGKIKVIFEIDQFPKQGYIKTICGSILQGMLFAKYYAAKFVEIVPNDENGRKACRISAKFKNMFEEALPQFCVVRVQKSEARANPKNHTQWDLEQKLKQIMDLKNWKGCY